MDSRMYLLIEITDDAAWGVYLVDTETITPSKKLLIRCDQHESALRWARRLLMIEDIVDLHASSAERR